MDVNVILYDDFETMDAFLPVSILGCLPGEFHINYLSMGGDIVNSSQGVKVWTEFLEPEQIKGVVLVPGGKGARRVLHRDQKLLEYLKRAMERADTCLMVGNSSTMLAQTGLLYRRLVADCHVDENWKRMFTAEVKWTSGVRWISDGKYYSCSSDGAASDMILGYIADSLDVDMAGYAAEKLGLLWEEEE
ncbi:DJ-1/PfpI family protein [Qiania dongpingensis]|uniref:DJ-1/PfpI family protein n=1 Tax=Qiania dongpingensis TaxID=2763669 RepID=A0A7G9G2L0_9FIRM|nr:DJ-1/PfpI family protein [Qiania dongpingensis]QNM05042.1 DJ-1/PfpI family protein [Qiania dongpingensis]